MWLRSVLASGLDMCGWTSQRVGQGKMGSRGSCSARWGCWEATRVERGLRGRLAGEGGGVVKAGGAAGRTSLYPEAARATIGVARWAILSTVQDYGGMGEGGNGSNGQPAALLDGCQLMASRLAVRLDASSRWRCRIGADVAVDVASPFSCRPRVPSPA